MGLAGDRALAVAVAALFPGLRAFSTPVCTLRRRARPVAARVRFAGGGECDLGRAGLLARGGRGRFVARAAGVVVLVLVLAR